MNRNRLPRVLVDWLEEREFPYSPSIDKNEPDYLTDDEIYSAALELLRDIRSDMAEDNDLYTSADLAIMRRFVERESANHRRINTDDWYTKQRVNS